MLHFRPISSTDPGFIGTSIAGSACDGFHRARYKCSASSADAGALLRCLRDAEQIIVCAA